MSSHQCFSLDQTPAAEGIDAWLAMWSQYIGRTTCAMECKVEGSRFNGSMEFMELSHLKLFWATSSPFAVRRVTPSPCTTFSRGFKVMLQVRGNTSVRQEDRAVELGPGDWVGYDAGQPYEVVNHSEVEQMTVLVPRSSLVDRRDLRIGPLFQPHPSSQGLSRIFWEYLKSVVRECDRIDLQGERSIASATESMLMQMLSNAAMPAASMAPANLKETIKHWIDDNLHDPDLSLDTLASALNTTKRSLHRAFGAESESISDYIWRTRIQRCQQILEQSSTAWSVTDLAFAHGFKDLAHFSRRFKQLTGVSPSGYGDRCKL